MEKHKLTRKWDGVVKLAYDMIKDEKEMAEFMTEKKNVTLAMEID